jgi:hypothetical protein
MASGRLLADQRPTLDDIHPLNWALLIRDLAGAETEARQSTTEGWAETVQVLHSLQHFLTSVGIESPLLGRLIQAMSDVRDGHEHPLTTPPRRTSRPKESSRLKSIKGWSAATLDVLMESGATKWDAAKTVSSVLAKNRFCLTGDGKKATAKTVAAWRDRLIGCSTSDPAARHFQVALDLLRSKKSTKRWLSNELDPKVKARRALSGLDRILKNLV